MANGEQLAKAGLCSSCCICCLKSILLTSQWTVPRGGGCSVMGSVSSLYVSLPKEQIGVALCLEHDIPSLEPEWDTICYLFVLSQTFQWHERVLGIKTPHPLHFSFALQFQQDYYCSLFYQVWQTCQWLGFRAVCPGISAYCPLEQKTDWTDVSDTLCDASPTNPVCGICCERLNCDTLLLLSCQEKKGSLI